MSDNYRIYRRIMSSLRQLYPKRLTGNQARHMNTTAGMTPPASNIRMMNASGISQTGTRASRTRARASCQMASNRILRAVRSSDCQRCHGARAFDHGLAAAEGYPVLARDVDLAAFAEHRQPRQLDVGNQADETR